MSEISKEAREAASELIASGGVDRQHMADIIQSAIDAATAPLKKELRLIAEQCGVKVEGDITMEMVHALVEGEIEKQYDLRLKAQMERDQLRAENERLEQRVADFQAAGLIDVGGQNGPCLVEPHHIEKHVTDLRVEAEKLKAQCAAMREVLATLSTTACHGHRCYNLPESPHSTPRLKHECAPECEIRIINAALANNAGADLLAQLVMAEDAAKKGEEGRKLGTALEECCKENERLKAALSSGLCSAHSPPDPLNCELCNKVHCLSRSNADRMAIIDRLHANVTLMQKGAEVSYKLSQKQDAAIYQLRAQLTTAQQDSKRLDWVFAHTYEMYWGFHGVSGTEPKTRTKIDAAMKEKV